MILLYALELAESVSKVQVRVMVQGKGEMLVDFFRHLSPVTINTLMRQMPIHGRVTMMGDSGISVLSQITTGVEKSKSSFLRGDVAFLSINGSICLFLKESKTTRPMNSLGKIASGIEILDKVRTGDAVTFSSN